MPSVLKEINCELEGNVVHTVIEYYCSVEHEKPGSSRGRQTLAAPYGRRGVTWPHGWDDHAR